ncbi:hypothetical protein, conserved [Eimeria praecox]|uniref:Transmembrane protein n=1 Tax=Eimeria praecox TaxID=51316 RepID=U6H9K1_9EIME|nr:hypothetical protein, conserved [Eimeria praecox]
MLRSVVIAAAAAYMGVVLPERTSAAEPLGSEVAVHTAVENAVEEAPQEQVPPVPMKTASLSSKPVLGVALIFALSTALFLLLKCIQRSASSQKEAGVSRRRLAGSGDEEDECKEIEEALASGGGDGKRGDASNPKEDEEKPKEGPPEPDVEPHNLWGDDTIDSLKGTGKPLRWLPERVSDGKEGERPEFPPSPREPVLEEYFTSEPGDEDEEWGAEAALPAEDEEPVDEDTLFGPPEPAVTVGFEGAWSRIKTMKLVLQRVTEAENSPDKVDDTDEVLGNRLRHAGDCRRAYKNTHFDDTVPEEIKTMFEDLVYEIENLLWRTSGRTRESDSK